MGSYTLGLDIGSNSIGWALVETKKKPSIVGTGVRVFPEGVDRDTKGLEKSKNATRREARGARRTHQRRNLRKGQLLKILQKAGFLPTSEPELRSVFHTNPYELRKKGLDKKLERHEFGRVLYHISQRRGFKSNRKSGKAKEDGVVIKEANALQAEMDAKECRTIGEYFAGLNPEEQRIRGKYTFRSMYEKEFDLLWTKQSVFYPDVLTEVLRRKIKDEIIFFQRPLKPQDKLIGDCELEPGEKRCPRGDWYARRFRLLQDVNNLVIQNPDGTEQKLSNDQRKILLEELSQKEKLPFGKIRKKLGLMETQKFNAEYRISKSGKTIESLKGDNLSWAMRKKNIFGPKVWDAMNEQEKMKLNEWLVELEDDQLREKLRMEYGFDDKQIEAILKISLPQGYMSFSRKAIIEILEFMEQGAITSEAIAVAYRDRKTTSDETNLDKLPMPEDLRNPIVNKALFEVRKVVNAIVREYGKPGKIKIEMARDLKRTKRERQELHWKQEENRKRNEEVRKRLIKDKEIQISDTPSRNDIIKYKLWEECNWTCPYTGRQIGKTELFSDHPTFDVEHILPYDRSLDDSYMNKTLCEVDENRNVKKNQTPYEAYGHDTERFEAILQRVAKSKMPHGKKQRFWQKELDLEKHISRELNDTRYICKEVIRYLKQLDVPVTGTRGGATAELRHQWGLDGIFTELDIRRDNDHRRHAVDAVVVGVTENEHLRKLARSKYETFDQPWSDFREEVRENVKRIKVSHRPTRKVSGRLHEETYYGPTRIENVYIYRKSLQELTGPMVQKIVDPVVRKIVTERLLSFGFDPQNNPDKPPKEVWAETLYMKNTKSEKKVRIKKVRIKEVFKNIVPFEDTTGHTYKAAKPGNNHHVEIFEYTEGEKCGQRDSEVVTMFEAARRNRLGEPVVRRDRGVGTKFICSLSINDTVMLKDHSGNSDLYRVQKMDANKMVRFRHHTASTIDQKETYIDKTAHLFEGRKVTIDPLGRIRPAND
jgi:CRISPR-associated endonuclease Csn1